MFTRKLAAGRGKGKQWYKWIAGRNGLQTATAGKNNTARGLFKIQCEIKF